MSQAKTEPEVYGKIEHYYSLIKHFYIERIYEPPFFSPSDITDLSCFIFWSYKLFNITDSIVPDLESGNQDSIVSGLVADLISAACPNTSKGEWEDFILDSFSAAQADTQDATKIWRKMHSISTNDDFFKYIINLISDALPLMRNEIESVDTKKYPEAKLALLYELIIHFKHAFLSSAEAVGSYCPKEYGSWGENDSELPFVDELFNCESGTLRTSANITLCRLRERRNCPKISCEFTSSTGENYKWESGSPYLTDVPNTTFYEEKLFHTWEYTTGRFLWGNNESECAYWLVRDTNEIKYFSDKIKEKALRLSLVKNYKELSTKTITVATNNNPQWWPARIKWSYVKEIDTLINEIETTLEISGFKKQRTDSYKTKPQKQNNIQNNKISDLIRILYTEHFTKKNIQPLTQKQLCSAMREKQPNISRYINKLFPNGMSGYKKCFTSGGQINGFMKELKDGTFDIEAIYED